MKRVGPAGAQAANSITLRLPLEVAELFREWVEQTFPDRAARIMGRPVEATLPARAVVYSAIGNVIAWLLYGGTEGGEDDDGGIGRGEGAPRPWQPRPAQRHRGGPPRRPDLTPAPMRSRVRVR